MFSFWLGCFMCSVIVWGMGFKVKIFTSYLPDHFYKPQFPVLTEEIVKKIVSVLTLLHHVRIYCFQNENQIQN